MHTKKRKRVVWLPWSSFDASFLVFTLLSSGYQRKKKYEEEEDHINWRKYQP